MSEDRETRMEGWVKRMQELQRGDDQEEQHVLADAVLCEVLEYLGCHRLVEEYAKVPKWYA